MIYTPKRIIALYTLSSIALAGCSAVPVATCPAIIPYTPQQQNQAADELDQLGPQSMLSRFMRDYGILRERLRVCQ